jgi:uncharacterized membrane protein
MDPEARQQLDQVLLQLRELREANAVLTRRVFALETEVARQAVDQTAAARAPVSTPPPLPLPTPPSTPAPIPVQQSQPQPDIAGYDDRGFPLTPAEVAERMRQAPAIPPGVTASDAAETPNLETNVGLTWINRIGAVTVMLGVAFFFKYAVDNDWVGPAGRVILGVLAGLGAIFAGDRLWHKGQKIFAQGIQAVGSSILYFAFFAAYSFYGLIPQSIAFVLMFLATAMTGALSLRYDARATLLLALFGGWSTPFLLSKGEPNDLFFISYMFVLNSSAMYVSRLKNWALVETIALAGTWLLHMAWSAERAPKLGRLWAALFTGLNWGVAMMSTRWWILLLGQFAAAVALALAYQHHWGETQGLALALFVGGLAVFWIRNVAGAGGAIVALLGYWFGQAVMDLSDREQHLTELLTCYTAVYVVTLAWTRLRSRAGLLHKSDLVATAASGVFYYGASYELLDGEYKAYLGLFTAAVAASYLALAYFLYSDSPEGERDLTAPLLAAGLALAFLALAVPVQLSGYRITLGWAVQAAALAWIAYKLRDWRILIGSALLSLLAVGRLTGDDARLYWPPLPDGESYTLLLNPRFISFLVVCGSLFLTAWWTSKMESVPRKLAGIPYILSHVLLIWGIHLELFAYVDSRTDITSPTSIKTLVSSLILAGYGFQFIASGFARRAVLPRILGLILFGIVIVKLYIYDIWLLGVSYRMIAFIVLGGMLLGGSYLYSRYRDKLSTLIREE